jgi:predicted nuclease of predicted toxin-antitoxin system
LLADEDTQSRRLVLELRAAGHDVQTTREANPGGKADSIILDYAIANERVLLSQNCNDFRELSQRMVATGRNHCGVLLIYRYNDPDKDMNYKQIAAAITNVENSGIILKNLAISVNAYNYRIAAR